MAKKKPALKFDLPAEAVKAAMPGKILPMKAKLVDEAFDSPEWIFEIKWDGYRAISNIKDGKAILYSRNGLTFEHYQTIYEALQHFPHDVILDGEIVALNDDGNPDFSLIQNYQRLKDVMLRYYIFDLIYFDGFDLRQVPLVERKVLLEKLLKNVKGPIRYSDHVPAQGLAIFKFVSGKGMEGIVAKKANSSYQFDKRSDNWLKIKTGKRQEVIICGFNPPNGSRQYIGSLVLGVYKDKKLIYCGNCGTGFTVASLKAVHEILTPLITKSSPFSEKIPGEGIITWVKPEVVCEIAFSEWTNNGTMRHPVFQGLRQDKKAKQVVRENETATKQLLKA